MPLAQIDDNGTAIYYEDTGVPDGSSTYPTIVITHGLLINSGIPIPKFNEQPLTRNILLLYHDPPSHIYGVVPDLGFTWPFVDPTVPPERKADEFVDWVSEYNTPPPDGTPITVESMRKYFTTTPRTPTLRTLSPEDYERTVELHVRSGGLIMTTDEAIRRRHTRCTYLDADAVLPNVDIVFLFCEEEAAEPGKRKRKTTFQRLKNANHFLQWDDPERMIRIFAEHCYNRL
ncbi:uncharacterized protein PHACADRAFT_197542 [Phanerochaete carnosa HHB-10118-sp]|uniref:AB hydrolase-1 domain-containing protein n=1 Tax=Phanerochaete carnosa (strain HHB-10118-sp) TaxID=650164 RepID=K5WRU1_PHACS|nr:uncharacterized protein PHACADRAFT_197542 [Phanerochaete carnosa HHB-10118-sp]EKM53112.1 hypothetical protein PHACADRAFT_197542 [Phanerochaete carnosa HHB-10118-sp]